MNNSDMQVPLSDELINEDEYSNKTLCFISCDGMLSGLSRAWIWSEPKGLVEILLNVAKKNKIKYLFYLRTYRNIEGGVRLSLIKTMIK
jgi:hypothetical protein